jgi:anti-sigma B factor antagonist
MVPELEGRPVRAVVDRRPVRGMTVVTLAGELDIADFLLLGRQLRRMPDAPLPSVVVDLTQVAFIDCSVLRVFVSVHRRAQLHAGCLRIAAPQPEPLHLLRTSRLDQVFCLFGTLQAAVEPVCVRHLSTS